MDCRRFLLIVGICAIIGTYLEEGVETLYWSRRRHGKRTLLTEKKSNILPFKKKLNKEEGRYDPIQTEICFSKNHIF